MPAVTHSSSGGPGEPGSDDSVLMEIRGPVAVVTINRPDVRNAVDRPTAELLAEAFRTFEADHHLVAAVLTGAGGVFCAGADLKAISTSRGNRVDVVGDGPMGPTRMELSKPVIAAVEGYAVAGGLELAAWCDLRVASRDAVFGVFCRRWGVPLVDGGTVRLPRLIGHSHAIDLILTGRGVSGDEAKTMGLANRIVEPGCALDEAVALAASLDEFPRACMLSDRRSAIAQWDVAFDQAMANETVLGRAVIESGETRDGAARFASGRGRGGSFDDL